jgi:hypothetical protein
MHLKPDEIERDEVVLSKTVLLKIRTGSPTGHGSHR